MSGKLYSLDEIVGSDDNLLTLDDVFGTPQERREAARARQQEILRHVPQTFDAPLSPQQQRQKDSDVDRLIGLGYIGIGEAEIITRDAYKTADPKDYIQKEIDRRRYRGFLDELGVSLESGGESAIGGLIGTAANGLRTFARSEIFWPLTRFGPLERQAQSIDLKARDMDKWAQTLYEDTQRWQAQPGEGGGLAGFIANAVGRTLPYFATATAAGVVGGPGATWAVTAAIEGDSAYRDAIASGATEENAQLARIVVGTVNGVIEMAQVGEVLKMGEGASAVALQEFKRAVADRAWKKVGKSAGKLTVSQVTSAVNEGAEEVAQEWVGAGAARIIYDKPMENMAARTGSAFAGGAVGGGILGGGSLLIQSGLAKPGEVEYQQEQGQTPPEIGRGGTGYTPRIQPTGMTADEMIESLKGDTVKIEDLQEAVARSAADQEARAKLEELFGKKIEVPDEAEVPTEEVAPVQPESVAAGMEEEEESPTVQESSTVETREGIASESHRRSELGQATRQIKGHPAYQAAMEGGEAQSHTTTDVANRTIYIDPKYEGDIIGYAGEDRRGALWRHITFDKTRGDSWDSMAEEAGLPTDFDGFMAWLKDAVENKGRGTLNEKALDAALTSRDPELELLALKHSMLRSQYTGPEVNAELETVAGEIASDYGLTEADKEAILERVKIRGKYAQEASQSVQPGIPGEASPTPGSQTDTGIFGQAIFRPSTGQAQGELGLEFTEAKQQPVSIKPALASEVAKLAGKHDTARDLYASELLGRDDLFNNAANPLPEVQEAWDQATLGRRLDQGSTSGGKLGSPGTVKATNEIDRGRIQVSMEPSGKRVSAREIIDYAKRAFGVTIRGKATHRMRRALGWYDTRAGGVRLKDVRSLTTAMHEIGHFLDWKTNDRWSRKPGSKAIADELTAMGKALYGNTKPTGGYKSEGWAEFTREYLTGEEAETKAPNLYRWFTTEYLPQHPDVAKGLNTVKEMIGQWRSQGAEARIESQINRKPVKGTIWERLAHRTLWFDTMFRDELAPLRKRLQEAGVEDLAPSEDPVALSVAYADKAPAKARHWVMECTTDLAGNRTGKGLREIIEPVRQDLKTFTCWIVAKRALLLWSRDINPGISLADAQHVHDKYRSPEWDQIAREITEWNHRLLDYLKDSGAIATEAVQKIKDLNPVYVPFMRAFAEGENQAARGTGKGIAKVGKPVKAIKGSGREIVDPFETMIQQAERIFSTAQKSMVAKSLAKLADRPGMAQVIWEVPAPTQAVMFSAEQLKKDIVRIAREKLGLDPDVISSSMMEEWDDVLTVYYNASQYYGKDNIVSLVVDGHRHFYEVDPDVYRVLEGLDQYSLPWFLSIFGKATRMLRLGATGLNASFGLVRNFIRDSMTFTVLAEHAKAGPLSAVTGVAKDIANTDVASKFKAMGGKMSAQILQDRRATQNLRSEMTESFVVRTVLHPIDALRELFGVTESGVRVAEFDAALKVGEKRFGQGSLDAAVFALNAAQDVTTNFTRHGRVAKVLNQLIPFFNAAIQGPDKIARTFRERPVRTLLTALASLTVPAVLLWWRNKDEEWYKKLEPSEKARYLHFRIPGGDTIVRIPIPFELGHVFQSIPVAVLDARYNKDPEEVTRAFSEAARDANPLDWPSLIGPAIDVMRNEDWASRPIVTEGMARKLPEDQYKPYTTQLMRWIGKTLGESPAQIEYLVNSYTGGLYGRVARTFDVGANGPESPSDWPVIGTLILRDSYRPSRKIAEFYDELEFLEAKSASEKTTLNEERQLKAMRSAQRRLSLYWKELRSEDIADEKKKEIYGKIETWIDRANANSRKIAQR